MNTPPAIPQRFSEGDWVRVVGLPELPPFVADAFNRRAPRVGDVAQVVDLREEAPEYELECRSGDHVEWLRAFASGEADLERCPPPDPDQGRGKRAAIAAFGLLAAACLAALLTPWARTLVVATRGEVPGFLELLMSLEDRPAMGMVIMVFLALFCLFLVILYFGLEAARSWLRDRR